MNLSMPLPINIDDLLNPNVVENERVEFKEGWNPEDILHTMCAFADDISNLGGGYIIVGVADKDGQPVFPAKGVATNELDVTYRSSSWKAEFDCANVEVEDVTQVQAVPSKQLREFENSSMAAKHLGFYSHV